MFILLLVAIVKNLSAMLSIFPVLHPIRWVLLLSRSTEEEAGSKRLRNLPKNTNLVKGGPSKLS